MDAATAADAGAWHAGLTRPLRRLLGGVLELGRLRLALLETELELEKRRLLSGVVLGGLALLLLQLGLLLLCAFAVLAFAEGYRLLALGGLTGLFLLAGLALLLAARRQWRNEDGIFAASTEELRRDRAWLADQ
jgi:uncharacterized membrane protein YqjE